MVTDRSVARPRVVLAEDFVLIQEAVRLAIGRECDLVAAVEDAEAAVHAVEAHLPDVLDSRSFLFPAAMASLWRRSCSRVTPTSKSSS